MTFEQAFVKIKEKFKDADIKKFTNDFAIQVNLTDEDCGGAFYVQFMSGKLFVEPYDYHDNTADITLARADFNKLLSGKLNIEKALTTTALYVNGDMDNVFALSGCAKSPAKKPATKKPAAKKAAPAKAEVKASPKAAPVKAEVKVAPKAAPAKAEVKVAPKVAPAKAEVKVAPAKATEKKTTK